MSFYSNRPQKTQKSKRDYQDKNSLFDQKHWIGVQNTYTAAPSNSNLSDRNKNQWISKQEDLRTEFKPQAETRVTVVHEQKMNKSSLIGNKSPVELMQDILKRTRLGQEIRSYYSQESEQTLSELLTNKFKMNNYIKKLQNEMVGLDSVVVKNYEILVLLLQQVNNSDVEIRQSEQGMQIKFNRSIIQRQEGQIEKLQKEKDEREKQMKQVIQKYESIIFDFNDVIEKLVNKQQGKQKVKF